MIPFGLAIASRAYRRVCMMCAGQMGKTDILLDCIGHRMDQAPSPILYVGPTKQFLNEQFEPRVMTLLDEAATLRDKVARGKRMTKTRKVIAGNPLRLAHGGSSTALKSDPASLAVTDEADELMASVKGQGNPLGLIDVRGDTYADFVHAITSTPSEGSSEEELDERSGLRFWKFQRADDISSTIWKIWQEGTRYHWCWPCKHCHEYFVPRFSLLRWPDLIEDEPDPTTGEITTRKLTTTEIRLSAMLYCPRCDEPIGDEDKAWMNSRGRYVAPGQTIDRDGIVKGEPPRSETISFWVSGLASPFRPFGARASNYVEAARSHEPERLQTAVNGGLGELWSPGVGEATDWEVLAAKGRSSSYAIGEVPSDVHLLTLAADVQKMAIYWSIRGWGPRSTSWLIDYGKLIGSTIDRDIWIDLADLITTPVDGLPIRLAFVDSGFRPGKVDEMPLNRVYEFCRNHKRVARPTKGSSAPMVTPLIVSRLEVTTSGRISKFGLELVRLDPDHWKSAVHERMEWPDDQPGAWHLPNGVSSDYCRQIVSEVRVRYASGRPKWVRRNRDNHYLDVEAMQLAAAHMLNVQRIPPERQPPSRGGVREGPLRSPFAPPTSTDNPDPYL